MQRYQSPMIAYNLARFERKPVSTNWVVVGHQHSLQHSLQNSHDNHEQKNAQTGVESKILNLNEILNVKGRL